MKRKLSKETEKLLVENNMTFEIANLKNLNEIYELYNSRTNWFKENNIKQWSRYIIRHESEFEIIAGFELSNNPGYFKDNGESLYLNKVVSKVGYKNIVMIITFLF